MLFMNILMSNLQVMFNGLYFISLFEKIAACHPNGLNPVAESPAGLGHGVAGEFAITSVIFATKEAAVLWGALFTSRSHTLQT
jgi:hypothetical protein